MFELILPSGDVFNFISQMTFGESLIALLLVMMFSFSVFKFVIQLLDREGFI